MVGNIPNFTKIDIVRCFLRLDKKIGRQDLARELELGEGTVRTILSILKSKKLLDSTKKGHFLSNKGNEILNKIFHSMSMPKSVEAKNIYPEFKKFGILIKDTLELKELYKLRDIAVKSGADGAIVFKFEGRLYALESNYNKDYNELAKYFDFEKNDVLVMAFSNDNRSAENGVLAIVAELNKTLKNFINEF